MDRMLRILEAVAVATLPPAGARQCMISAGLRNQPPNGLDFQQKITADVGIGLRLRCAVLQPARALALWQYGFNAPRQYGFNAVSVATLLPPGAKQSAKQRCQCCVLWLRLRTRGRRTGTGAAAARTRQALGSEVYDSEIPTSSEDTPRCVRRHTPL
jgi:hypothetical protein